MNAASISEVLSTWEAAARSVGWRRFYDTTDADRKRHMHVVQSHFHDIVPASELGSVSPLC